MTSGMPHQHQVKTKIVILGAGFGGVYTFLNLRKLVSPKKAEITIINKTNHFLFTPLLHEVATGSLAHHQVVESVRSITYQKGASVHVADVLKINTARNEVETSIGLFHYDVLVIATGASAEFYGIPGAADKTMSLKTLADAIRMRNRFIDTFEKAVEIKDLAARRKLLTFVLVGGGATGVELAAEMAELFFDTFQKYFCGRITREEISIELIAAEPELLSVFNHGIQLRAREVLTREGVHVRTAQKVKAIDDNGVLLSDGARIETQNVIWVGGVRPNVPAADRILVGEKTRGRILVDHTLKVVGTENVYALGDVATFEDENLPMHAQMAVQAAKIAAQNVYRTIRGKNGLVFTYKSVGDLVSLGQWQAAGYFFNILWTGPVAWFVWRTVYLFKYASWPKRIKIAVDWTIDMFYPRDITKA